MTELTPELYAFVDYTDDKAYVEPLIITALLSSIPSIKLLTNGASIPSTKDLISENSKLLTWTAYETLDFPTLLSHPTTHFFNAYIIRKALIRKHYLLNTISSYIRKQPTSILTKAAPLSVAFEVDYAEFLDEALVEEYELLESMEKNEGIEDGEKREWWILKPGMSDRGAGIRLFSKMEELQGIFEEWEEESEEEDEDEDEKDEDEIATSDTEDQVPKEETEKKGSGIVTSRLRHFVAQQYIPPILLTPQEDTGPGPRKFHIRTYILAVGALKVYVYKNMLALFAAKEYTHPSAIEDITSPEVDLAAHLTNTCLQSGVHDGSVIPFWNLTKVFTVDQKTVEGWFGQVCEITGDIFKAALSGGRIHFQPLPNAFEIFGLDFLVGEDGGVRVLEVNAFPDFKQTGEEEKELVQGLFEEVTEVVKREFFDGQQEERERMVRVADMEVGRF